MRHRLSYLVAGLIVLAGGVSRSVSGEIGIHRPYSTYVGNRDYESVQKEYRRTETAVKNYLNEMNIPGQLFEAMVSVPSENMRILTEEETKAFGLSSTDPVEAEFQDANMSMRYGLSKTEYLRRKVSGKEYCQTPDKSSQDKDLTDKDMTALQKWFNCREAYMFGVDVQTYEARQQRAMSVCKSYKSGTDDYFRCRARVIKGN